MKKIKLFFQSRYCRLIRLAAAFSSSLLLVFGVLSVSAVSPPTVYSSAISQPQLTGNDCYLEVVTSNGWKLVLYVTLSSVSDSSTLNSVSFNAYVVDNKLLIGCSSSIPGSMFLDGYYYDCTYGTASALSHVEAGNSNDSLWISLVNSGSVTGIHGYNCSTYSVPITNSNFVFSYGVDSSFNNLLTAIRSSVNSGVGKLDTISSTLVTLYNQNKAFFGSVNMQQILQAIQDNKSSAENNEYTSPDTSNASQYESAESQLMDTTSSGRSSAVDTMKGIGGILDNHVGKSLLATSKLMSEFLGIPWLSDIVHFSLVCGLFAFVLGISVMIISSFGNWHVASRYTSVDSNTHRKRLGK